MLLTYTAGLACSIAVAVAGALASELAAYNVQMERDRPEFATLRDGAGFWNRSGLRWYLRERRHPIRTLASSLFLALIIAPMVFLPLTLLQPSRPTVGLATIGMLALTETGILLSVVAVSRAGTDRQFVDFSLAGDQVTENDQQRAAFNQADYRLRCAAAAVVAVVYLCAPRGERLPAEPDTLTRVASEATTWLPIVLAFLAWRLWQRSFVVVHTLTGITAVLHTAPDPSPQLDLPHPLRVPDAGHQLRDRLSVMTAYLDRIGKRVEAAARGPARHPLPVLMWSACDETAAYLRSPQSLTGELTPRMRELAVALLVVLTCPADEVVGKTIVADQSAFDADWSARRGGVTARLSARIVAITDHLDHLKKAIIAVTVIVIVLTTVVLGALGDLDIKEVAEIVAGFN